VAVTHRLRRAVRLCNSPPIVTPDLGVSYTSWMRTYNCIQCGEENTFGHSKTNKFCDNRCQGDYKWENDTKPRIEAGNCNGPNALKRYLFETKGERCSECGQGPVWNNKPLTLQLDHVDGDSDNNVLSNLRILCPHCHTQTETYGSKGRGSRYKKVTKRNTYLQGYKARAVS